MVEEDLGSFLNKQKEEMRILRGVALNTYGDSYLDRMQRIAEMESTLKVSRLERDIPKFQRATDNWASELQSQTEEGQKTGSNREDTVFERQSIEDLL